MMEEQMLKAEIMVKEVEAKFRALPNPFEDEVVELRERVEQQKAGLENLRIENLNLEREAREAKKEKDRVKVDLEKKLVFATTVLNEVAGMEAIKG